MKTINIGQRNEILPIEWEPYKGENVCVNTTIRQGKRIQDIRFFEDKVKAVPRGNAYCIGNGPSRKDFDLNKLKRQDRHTVVMHCTEISCQTLFFR